jgi:hypothetical protein
LTPPINRASHKAARHSVHKGEKEVAVVLDVHGTIVTGTDVMNGEVRYRISNASATSQSNINHMRKDLERRDPRVRLVLLFRPPDAFDHGETLGSTKQL